MRLMILLALLLVSGSLSAQTQGAIKRVHHVSRFELAVACIKKYEGLHGPKHHPYVGYGHKLLPLRILAYIRLFITFPHPTL